MPLFSEEKSFTKIDFFSLIKQTHHAKGRSSVSEFKSAQYFVSGLYAWYKIKQQSCKSSQQQIKH